MGDKEKEDVAFSDQARTFLAKFTIGTVDCEEVTAEDELTELLHDAYQQGFNDGMRGGTYDDGYVAGFQFGYEMGVSRPGSVLKLEPGKLAEETIERIQRYLDSIRPQKPMAKAAAGYVKAEREIRSEAKDDISGDGLLDPINSKLRSLEEGYLSIQKDLVNVIRNLANIPPRLSMMELEKWHHSQHNPPAEPSREVKEFSIFEAFIPGLGTVRDCLDCGCLVPGGPTRCKRCAREVKELECDLCGGPIGKCDHSGEGFQ